MQKETGNSDSAVEEKGRTIKTGNTVAPGACWVISPHAQRELIKWEKTDTFKPL